MTINKTENQNTEFKQSWRDEYLKWVCAFANTDGGILYIGISDNGEVCGVEDSTRLSEEISNKILATMGLVCEVFLHDAQEKTYIEIKVEKYPFPVSYHGKYYKHSGSTTQEVGGLELEKMILSVHGRTWDSIPIPNVTLSDLDNDSIKLFKKRALELRRLDEKSLNISDDELIHNLRGFENHYLTRTAVMCFHPDPEKWVTGAYIKIGYFATEADILYQDEIHGSLLLQVEKTMNLIFTKYMKALIKYDGIHRQEIFFFPPSAFRELLLNAIIHKDYMEPYPIQIKIYKNHISLWNPGKMPVEVNVEDLFKKHISKPRNPNIANVFFKSGYVESWGRGYYNIKLICEETNSKLPVTKEEFGGISAECFAKDEYLVLEKKWEQNGQIGQVHQNDELSAEISNKTPKSSPKSSPKTTDIILELIIKNPEITTQQIADIIGISKRAVLKNLAKMKDQVIHIGHSNGGHWEIVVKD